MNYNKPWPNVHDCNIQIQMTHHYNDYFLDAKSLFITHVPSNYGLHVRSYGVQDSKV